MIRYRITGVTTSGEERRGTIEASSEDDALRKAKQAGIFATKVEPVRENLDAPDFAKVEPPAVPSSKGGTDQLRPPRGEVLISSGSICSDFQVVGLVVGFASKAEGCNGTIAVEGVYHAALQRLIESAKAQSANGLMHVNFQNRVSSQAGCGGPRQAFEVFAWGTAIRF